jgi:hypothetical protein
MLQLIVVLVAIGLIPVLLRFKLPIGAALFILGIFVGVAGGLSPKIIFMSFSRVFTVRSSLNSVLIIIEIGMLSILMNRYGILKRMENALLQLIPNDRAIIMFMPAMVGALQAPGGAALSAPFVNGLGTEMGMSRAQRSNINVVCRHILPLLVPYSANVIVALSLAPGIKMLHLVALNLGFVILMQIAGYIFLVRKSEHKVIPGVSGAQWIKALGEFFLTFSPILLAVALNAFLGWDYTITVLFAIGLVYLLCDKKDFPRQLLGSFDKRTAILIVGVYFFQNVIRNLSALMSFFQRLFTGQSQWAFLVLVALVAVLFGLATGLMYLPLGVLVPIAMSLPWASYNARLVAMFYTFSWCFVGYLFSPIHLCQLLSDQATGATVKERYTNYLPVLIALPFVIVGLYFVYNLILA